MSDQARKFSFPLRCAELLTELCLMLIITVVFEYFTITEADVLNQIEVKGFQ